MKAGNILEIDQEKHELGQIINIKEEDEKDEGAKNKKGLSRKSKIIFASAIIAMLGIGYLLLGMIFSDENRNDKDKNSLLDGIKSKDLIAQEAVMKNENIKKEDEINNIQDKTFESIDKSENVNDKSQGLMDYINNGTDGSASDNFIANEETSTPQEPTGQDLNNEADTLKDKLNTENISAPSRAIALKEDYALEKGTSFAYSKEYKKAENYDNTENDNNNTETMQSTNELSENEFEGLSEQQIKEKLMEKTLKAVSPEKTSNTKKQNENPTSIIYNKLGPVRLYEGQMLDGVLLNKLVSDTEESPVLISIAKDFYDSKGLYVIIPAGSRVIGTSQIVNYQGTSRLFVSFNRMILPNGISVKFPNSNKALDMQGSMGIATSVNRHFWQKMGAAIFIGLVDGLGGLAQSKSKETQWEYAIDKAQDNTSQTLNQVIQSNTNILPTITVKEGHKIKIYISSDIIISAYSLISQRSYSHE